MPKLFDTRASMHDILLSNVVMLVAVASLIAFWEILFLSAVILSPILQGLLSGMVLFMSPAYQRNLWNRYGQ